MRVGLVALVLGFGAVTACGGRYEVGARATGGAGAGGSAASAGSTGMSVAGTMTECVGCPVTECGPDQELKPDADGCCQHCEPFLDVCAQAQQDYAVEREKVIEEFASFTCDTAADCAVSYDPSNCGRDCSYLVVTAAGRGVLDRLVILGQRTCTGDCITTDVTCPAAPAPRCVMGQCVVPPR